MFHSAIEAAGCDSRNTLPGTSNAPPITTTRSMRSERFGSASSAAARFVSGPSVSTVTRRSAAAIVEASTSTASTPSVCAVRGAGREDAAVSTVGLRAPVVGKRPIAVKGRAGTAGDRDVALRSHELDEARDVARADWAVDEPRPGHRDRGDLHIGALQEVKECHRVVGPTVGVDHDQETLITRRRSRRRLVRTAPAGGEHSHRCQHKSHKPVSTRGIWNNFRITGDIPPGPNVPDPTETSRETVATGDLRP